VLGMVGFVTREAENGAEAVAIFEDWKPQVILLDMAMPVMDGYEVLHKIRGMAGGKDVVILAITASAFREDKQRVLVAGADGFLSKPFKEAELFDALHRLLGIEYIYRENAVQTAAEGDSAEGINAVNTLPPDLVGKCREAAVRADIFLLLELLQEVSQINPSFGWKLNDLARQYAYNEIINLLAAER
jgi:CheY-like chemotaxis protein